MQKKREISEYREKLDKTLSSPELTDHESLMSLLRNQLCSSPGISFFFHFAFIDFVSVSTLEIFSFFFFHFGVIIL